MIPPQSWPWRPDPQSLDTPQAAAETDPTRKTAFEKSLGTLVTMLEEMAPEIEREEAEAKDAQDFLQMLEQTYADAGTKLKQARSELERAQRAMSRAQQQRQSAEQRAEKLFVEVRQKLPQR